MAADRVQRVEPEQLPLNQRYMTGKQVAELCHVTELTIYIWEKAGRIHSLRPSGSTKAGKKLYRYEDVMRLIEGR